MTVHRQARVSLIRRSFDQIVNDFIDPSAGYLKTFFGDLRVQFMETGLGQALVELVAGVGEVFNVTATVEATEAHATTARQTASVILHADDMGYDYVGPLAATTKATLTFTDFSGDLFISAGLVKAVTGDAFNGSPLIFECLTPIIKSAGLQVITDVQFTQGESFKMPPTVSTGIPGDVFEIAQPGTNPIELNSVRFVVDGVPWTRVQRFLDSGPSDTHFRVRFREDIPGQRIYFVECGDGVTGAYPVSGASVVISARRCAGSGGRIPAGALTKMLTQVIAPSGQRVNVRITNPDASTDGKNDETIEEIRANGFRVMVTNRRIVSRDDARLAAIAGGARRAVCLTINEAYQVPENTFCVFVSNVLGGTLSDNEAQAIMDYVKANYPDLGTAEYVVVSAMYYAFRVELDVFCYKTARLDTTKQAVNSALLNTTDGFLTYGGSVGKTPSFVLDVGRKVKRSQISDVVDDIDSVDHVLIRLYDANDNLIDGDVVPAGYEIPWPTSVTVNTYYVSDND